jgi:hypothetical protein
MKSSSDAIQKRLKMATRKIAKQEFQVEPPKDKPVKFRKPPVGAVQRRLQKRRR